MSEQETLHEKTTRPVQPLLASLPPVVTALLYLAAFTGLDGLAYRPDINPALLLLNAGLPYILVLTFGKRYVPVVLLGPLVSELVLDQSTLPRIVELTRDLIHGGWSVLILTMLLDRRLKFDPALGSQRDLLVLFGMALLHASGVTMIDTLARGSVSAAGGLAVDWRYAFDHWVAYLLGIVMMAPLGIFVLHRRWHGLSPADWTMHIGSILILFAGLMVFQETQPFHSFYIFSLPLLWMAVRGGIEAASIGLAITQAGLIITARSLPDAELDVPSLQVRLLVLTVMALVIGALVVERLRIERQLRLHQEAMERMARIASMSQLTSSIAHEINQPLMAAGTYARNAARLLEGAAPETRPAYESAQKAAEQIARAGEVVHRLKALFKVGKTMHRRVELGAIVARARELSLPLLQAGQVTCQLAAEAGPARIMGDPLQLEQVFVNLIQNAIQAMGAGGQIEITIGPSRDGRFDVVVADNGPGLPQELIDGVPIPFFSTKDTGIGVGLALTRTIVEAHDGKLTLRNGPQGARITVSLPSASKKGP